MKSGLQRKQLIILALITILMLATIVLTFTHSSSSNTTSVKTTVTKDPTSGQSFVTQQGVAPESQVESNTPIFAGFDSLTNVGVSTEQVHALEIALRRYPDLNKNVQISLAVNSLQKNYPENSDPEYRWSISSYIVVNQKMTYHIKFYYSGTSSIQLYIYDASGKTQLFNSGVVTANS